MSRKYVLLRPDEYVSFQTLDDAEKAAWNKLKKQEGRCNSLDC